MIIIVLWPNVTNLSAQTGAKDESPEETVFSVEQDFAPVEKPVTLPPEALPALAQDKGVASCLKSNEMLTNQLPASWFVASRIHLGGPNETDYVVLPSLTVNPESSALCFLGANTGHFWILRKTSRSYDLVLTVITHNLEVLPSRSNGLRDIEAQTVFVSTNTRTLFKFDGNQYRKNQQRTVPNG